MREPDELNKKNKVESEPEKNNGQLTLADIIDLQAVQEMMEDFHRLTGMVNAVIDISGKVLVAVGWQDICTTFHRCHPDTLKNCLESDLVLSSGVPKGKFKIYRCRNNLWDVATPIDVAGIHLGNIFLGQFFLEDEVPDIALFQDQARQHGFDEAEYLTALARVPRWSREKVETAMKFLANMAGMISSQGYANYKFSHLLSQKDAALRQLAESQEKQGLILQTAMDGFWMTDLQGCLLDVNDAYCRMSGYRQEELLSMCIADLDAVENGEDVNRHIQKVMAKGHVRFESRHRRKDGSLFDVEVSAQYQPIDSGRIVAFLRDISDRKRAEEEKTTLETQIRKTQKLEAIGTLAGGIAHDFNNILSPILGRCEMLLDDLPNDSDVRRQVQSIMDSANRASGLVKQILSFSRQSEIGKVPVRMQEIIQDVLSLIRHSIPSTIQITLAIDATCDAVLADEGQMHQVIMNMVSNAYHAMENVGGNLEIGLSDVEVGPEKFLGIDLLPGRYLDFYISDTGIGMDEKIISRIFDPYFTTKPIGKGTGLGLTVSYGIIKKHGGVIHATSVPEQGTTFHVYLPVNKNQFLEPSLESPGVTRGGKEHILFVDDEYEVASSAVPMLERLGYQVTARTGSIDALADFRNDPDRFDLMVTDMTMPNMTGVQLAAEIHKIRPDFPIILCTGFSHQIDENNVGQMGIKALVMKPIVKDHLTSLIRRTLDNPK